MAKPKCTSNKSVYNYLSNIKSVMPTPIQTTKINTKYKKNAIKENGKKFLGPDSGPPEVSLDGAWVEPICN